MNDGAYKLKTVYGYGTPLVLHYIHPSVFFHLSNSGLGEYVGCSQIADSNTGPPCSVPTWYLTIIIKALVLIFFHPLLLDHQ